MGEYSDFKIQDWTPEHVRGFIGSLCESPHITEAQLEEINQKVDQDGIRGTTLLQNLDNLSGLFGDALRDVPPALVGGFRTAIVDTHRKAQDEEMPDGGENYAPVNDYHITFKEGRRQVSIRVSADMTLQHVIGLYIAKEGGDGKFEVTDSHRQLKKSKTLKELGLTVDGCTVNIIGKNNGG
eukprot:78590_1